MNLLAKLMQRVATTSQERRDNHEGRPDAQSLGFFAECCWIQFHHQENLNQQKRHGQEPIHVTVSIIEGDASQGWVCKLHGAVRDCSLGILIRFYPGVKDADEVICCNESHQARDQHCASVLFHHCE